MKRPATIALGVIVLYFALALVACVAHADLYYSDSDGDSVHVTELPCPPEIATLAPQGFRGDMRLTSAHLGDSKGRACAMPATHKQKKGPQVFIVFEDKTFWLIDLTAFDIGPSKSMTKTHEIEGWDG